METTVPLKSNVRKKLDSFKIDSTESYSDVILRILDECERHDVDEESLQATAEILSDPDALRDIAQAQRDYDKGRFVELK